MAGRPQQILHGGTLKYLFGYFKIRIFYCSNRKTGWTKWHGAQHGSGSIPSRIHQGPGGNHKILILLAKSGVRFVAFCSKPSALGQNSRVECVVFAARQRYSTHRAIRFAATPRVAETRDGRIGTMNGAFRF